MKIQNELRIGNFVNVPNKEQSPFLIMGLDIYTKRDGSVSGKIESFRFVLPPSSVFDTGVHPLTWEVEDVSGVPLTEEWLLKFGFQEDSKKRFFSLFLNKDDVNEYSRQVIDVWLGADDFQAAELCRSGVCFKRVKIKHVHQLQNLHFALTGTELTLTKL